MILEPSSSEKYQFDHAELELTHTEFNALNAICDHLESLKPGHGVSVKLGGAEKIFFLAPLSSNTNRLSSISIIPEGYANKKIQLPDSDELLVVLQEFESLSELVSIAKTIRIAHVRKIHHWDNFMADLKEAS